MKTHTLVPDDLWEAIEPLLPKEPPKPKGGRPRVPVRAALDGIIFALRNSRPWCLLPQELGCVSGVTCWRRPREWQDAGVWQRLHTTLLNWLGDEAAIAWSWASADSLAVPIPGSPSPPGNYRAGGVSEGPLDEPGRLHPFSFPPSVFHILMLY